MITLKNLERISPYVWEIPKSYRADMRVPARVYASKTLLEKALTDKSIEQLVNAATLPGIVGYAIAMPDVHQGYGFPVGGVAARLPDGVISPGSIGYDINCGVRLLASDLYADEVEPHLDDLAAALYHNCPSGLGKGGRYRLDDGEMDSVLAQGAHWCLKRGLATQHDVIHTEEGGRLPKAAPGKVSRRAATAARPDRHAGQRQPLPRGRPRGGDLRRSLARRLWPAPRTGGPAHSPARAGWAIRSAPTTCAISNRHWRASASNFPTAN